MRLRIDRAGLARVRLFSFLGGEDFDNRLVDYICDEFQKQNGVDLRKDLMALQRVRSKAEEVKKELSTVQQVDITEPYITAGPSGPVHLNMKLTRAKLEALVEDLVKRTIEPCKKALADAGKSISQIDEVVITNTIPLSDAAKACKKIRQLSVAFLFAETIRRISDGESVTSLFAEQNSNF